VALRNLTNWNDPIFRKKSKPIEKFDERLHTLLSDMRDTLAKVNGYGCTAVHIGVLRRAVVIIDGVNGVIELINPVRKEESEETQEVMEGSIAPGAPRGTVIRPQSVTVSAFDRNGNKITVKGDGFLAATFCHEIDHLDGIMFIDKSADGNGVPQYTVNN
jgi:peptide deformylase